MTSHELNNLFKSPPLPNLKLTIGSDTNLWFTYHAKTIPNAFQRWMMKKLMGINLEVTGEKNDAACQGDD